MTNDHAERFREIVNQSVDLTYPYQRKDVLCESEDATCVVISVLFPVISFSQAHR